MIYHHIFNIEEVQLEKMSLLNSNNTIIIIKYIKLHKSDWFLAMRLYV